MDINKLNCLHAGLLGVKLSNKNGISLLKYQSKFASKQDTGMQIYTMTKERHLTSFEAVLLGSFAHVRDTSKPEITGNAFSTTMALLKPSKCGRKRSAYSQIKISMMRMKRRVVCGK